MHTITASPHGIEHTMKIDLETIMITSMGGANVTKIRYTETISNGRYLFVSRKGGTYAMNANQIIKYFFYTLPELQNRI